MRLGLPLMFALALSTLGCGSDADRDGCPGCLMQTAPGVWVASDEQAVRKLGLCPMAAPELWSHSIVISGEAPPVHAEFPLAFTDGLQWAGADLPCLPEAGGLTLQQDAGWIPFLAMLRGPERSGYQAQVTYDFDELDGETLADFTVTVLQNQAAAGSHRQRGCSVTSFSSEPLTILARVSGRGELALRAISVEGTCAPGGWIGQFAVRMVAAAASLEMP